MLKHTFTLTLFCLCFVVLCFAGSGVEAGETSYTAGSSGQVEPELSPDDILRDLGFEPSNNQKDAPAPGTRRIPRDRRKAARREDRRPDAPKKPPEKEPPVSGTPDADSISKQIEASLAEPPVVITGGGSEQAGTLTLYLLPLNTAVLHGEEFFVDLCLNNPRKAAFDTVSILLKFDPAMLQVLDGLPGDTGHRKGINIDDRKDVSEFPFHIWADQDPFYENQVNQTTGLIKYKARVMRGTGTSRVSGVIGRIRLKAIGRTGRTGVQFVHYLGDEPEKKITEDEMVLDNLATYITIEQKNILGSRRKIGDGTIDCQIVIRRGDSEVAGVWDVVPTPTPASNVYQTMFAIVANSQEVSVGETFDLQVVLRNEDMQPFDHLSLLIGYDKNVLQVLDTDKGNYIKRGINIWDGPFHKKFPFEYHGENIVYSEKGFIDYRMGSITKTITSAGAVAIIRMRALTAATRTAVRFAFNEWGKFPNTALTLKGVDCLADGKDNKDGAVGITLRVNPVKK